MDMLRLEMKARMIDRQENMETYRDLARGTAGSLSEERTGRAGKSVAGMAFR